MQPGPQPQEGRFHTVMWPHAPQIQGPVGVQGLLRRLRMGGAAAAAGPQGLSTPRWTPQLEARAPGRSWVSSGHSSQGGELSGLGSASLPCGPARPRAEGGQVLPGAPEATVPPSLPSGGDSSWETGMCAGGPEPLTATGPGALGQERGCSARCPVPPATPASPPGVGPLGPSCQGQRGLL